MLKTGFTMRNQTCAIIADGPLPFPENSVDGIAFKEAFTKLLRSCALEMLCCEFVCGMEPGAELIGAEILLSIRDETGLSLHGVTASEEQWLGWSLPMRNRFFKVMENADSEYMAGTRAHANSRENQLKAVTDRADVIIAATQRADGPLFKIITEAIARGSRVLQLDPLTRSISELPSLFLYSGKSL